ncbi:UNVERIFIED_CONTAM: hypothetical protein Sradi_5693400 [Sesamum radiatum]|uniref:Uncharacterized protein n=1 Tax=Sesamum radiatum TaxID=300843 RepID=A0AAW2L510_SESRA
MAREHWIRLCQSGLGTNLGGLGIIDVGAVNFALMSRRMRAVMQQLLHQSRLHGYYNTEIKSLEYGLRGSPQELGAGGRF